MAACRRHMLDMCRAIYRSPSSASQSNHTKILDAKARQAQEQEQERWWAPYGECRLR